MMSIDVAIAPDIELKLPARAENVAIVRHAFGALGETMDVEPQTLSDILLAITEACTNVVVHAYPGEREGPMEVQATLLDGKLLVAVRDEGPGIVPRTDSPGLGLGLPLIASLAESVQLGHGNDGRTEVSMTFSLQGTSAWDEDAQQASSAWYGADPDGADPAGADPDGADPAGVNPAGADPDGADPAGVNPDGADPDGAEDAQRTTSGDWPAKESADPT